MPTIYLITGASRGVGLYLVQELIKREDIFVFAGARNPDTAHDLQSLIQLHPKRLSLVRLTSGNEDDLDAIMKVIKETAGKLDVVIGNAGICNTIGHPLEMKAQDMRDHFEVNTISNLVLFQKTYPLLQASKDPKFIVISAIGGSFIRGAPVPGFLVYGASKAAVNYLTRKIHFECPSITSFSICPGLVKSDMAAFALKHDPGAGRAEDMRLKEGDETAIMLMRIIDKATRENDGGTFTFYDGSQLPW